MLKLYYTGASSWKGAQSLVSNSLGGFISSITLPNGSKGSLFPDLSNMELWEDKKIDTCVGLALYTFFFDGEENFDYMNLTINLEYDKNLIGDIAKLFNFKIALAPISGDLSEGLYMEQITTSNDKPYYLLEDFTVLNIDNPVIFEKVSTKGVGIWLIREFDPKVSKGLYDYSSDYWLTNDNLPNLSFDFDINLNSEKWIM